MYKITLIFVLLFLCSCVDNESGGGSQEKSSRLIPMCDENHTYNKGVVFSELEYPEGEVFTVVYSRRVGQDLYLDFVDSNEHVSNVPPSSTKKQFSLKITSRFIDLIKIPQEGDLVIAYGSGCSETFDSYYQIFNLDGVLIMEGGNLYCRLSNDIDIRIKQGQVINEEDQCCLSEKTTCPDRCCQSSTSIFAYVEGDERVEVGNYDNSIVLIDGKKYHFEMFRNLKFFNRSPCSDCLGVLSNGLLFEHK